MPGTQTRSDNLQLVYQGSVKRVFAVDKQPGRLWFEFSDDYSVFDWGKMPDTIAHKGRALTVLGAHFFQELADKELWRQLPQSKALSGIDQSWLASMFKSRAYQLLCGGGMPSHFVRLCGLQGEELDLESAACAETVFMEVDGAQVFHPKPAVVLNQPVHYYAPLVDASAKRLVPLEVVFRFGMPEGSSLKERLEGNPSYVRQLGLLTVPATSTFFERPVIEFFTKLEPKDRLLTLPEALNVSTLNPEQFQNLCDLSMLAALALKDVFATKGIELWDGKFEFIFDGRNVLLADSIGPDELRLIYCGLQLSKEMIRQVYRDSDWERNLKRAQKLALERGSLDWKKICLEELKAKPQPLAADFKRKIDSLYPVLANHITGRQLFTNQPSLESFAQLLEGDCR